jgi:hypothetical protein
VFEELRGCSVAGPVPLELKQLLKAFEHHHGSAERRGDPRACPRPGGDGNSGGVDDLHDLEPEKPLLVFDALLCSYHSIWSSRRRQA